MTRVPELHPDADRSMHEPTLLIGVSARIYHPTSPVLDLGGVWTRTLHYLEQSVALWLMHGGALPVMIPAFEKASLMQLEDLHPGHFTAALDGLVLQGGADVSPDSYGERPLRPEWAGDPIRDRYEIDLIRAFVDAGKPVFGICRGLQILNVAFGGTLYQDLRTQLPHAAIHVSDSHYEHNLHALRIEPDRLLAGLYRDDVEMFVNSIHHQGIKDMAPSFQVEARCPQDDVIECISRHTDNFIVGVQWHPEFHSTVNSKHFDDRPLLNSFLDACRRSKRKINQ